MSLHSEIHVGYEIGTGRAVAIPLRHLAVTGQTQESGKTTTLEGLISRSGARAIAYVTKRGESSFHVANPIPPYFQERADWQFVQSLLEAAMSTKMDFKQPWIMRVSDGAKTLEDVRANLRRFIDGVPAPPRPERRSIRGRIRQALDEETKKRWLQKPATGLSADVYYVLDKYFDDVMPQIQNLPYSTSLELAPGLNVMDLRDYDFAVQALVVRSVTDRIRQHEEKTVNIIPEAWKFAPKQRGSPVRLAAEEYVRESAAMKNFLWVDSQDLAGVADVIMRQVGVWIFGVQRAKHEIERALDHMPEGLPSRRPRPADIATLGKGQFYVCFGREMYKVYVQPAWMAAAHAEAIARGEEDVESAREILRDFDLSAQAGKSSAAATKPAPLARAKTASASGAAAAEVNLGEREEEFDHEQKQSREQERTVRGAESESHSPRRGLSSRDLDRRPAGDSEVQAGDAADSIQQRSGGSGGSERTPKNEDDQMWKEKYEALTGQLHRALALPEKYQPTPEEMVVSVLELRKAHDALAERIRLSEAAGETVLHVAGSNGGSAPDLEKIFQYVKTRAANDPGILLLLQEHPELRVKHVRRTIEVDSTTVQGGIAILIKKGFFDRPTTTKAIQKELRRLGYGFKDSTVPARCGELVAAGFLTREENGYLAVPDMKINLVEA